VPARSTCLARSRRALDLAFRCQGARTAVQSGVRRDRESTDTERVVAATFSSTIREYSAGEHLPRAIICPRRPIVSQDANAISIIIKGNGTDFLRRRFPMIRRWEPTVGAARSVASSRRTATRGTVRRQDLTLVSFVSTVHHSTHASGHKTLLHVDRGRTMRKLLAMGALTISIASFGTRWAQGTTSPPQIQARSKTAPTQATHTSRSSAQQYKTEADAKSHCGADQVVWGNTSSHVLHDAGTKYYGKTAHGAYMCKGIAVHAGYHEAKE
jgi:hypothetical protein